jgi:branched-chain amino acid transport system substrate-binding protein
MKLKSLLSTVSLALLIGGMATAAQAQIAVGQLADYSGATSDVGTPYGQAVADTFAWVNKNGGIGGKQVALDTNDYGYQVRSTRSGQRPMARSPRSWAGVLRTPKH